MSSALDEAVDNVSDISPLEREVLHGEQERDGSLCFPIYENNGTDEAMIALTALKNIFAEQLPKMPKPYISRLVYDRQHQSLACVYKGEIVGGVSYRPVRSQAFSEIAFCAVSAEHQVQGYGTRIMNQLKEKCKRDGIEGLLTYADNHAIGYFRKQGFSKQVTLKRERWQGYIKDYEGATLVECCVDPTIDYLSTRQVAEQQRLAVSKRIAELSTAKSPGEAEAAAAAEALNAKRVRAGWPRPSFECRVGPPGAQRSVPLAEALTGIFEAVAAHADAWPFQSAVRVADAPDYYKVIKSPIDLSMIRSRLGAGGHYVSLDMLMADLCRMCENCRTYNAETTAYWDCATRLESFARQRAAEVSVVRLDENGSAQDAAGAAPKAPA